MAKMIGVDVGGTFTDIVVVDDGSIAGRKIPTTPDQSLGVADGVAGIEADTFLHGTTAATNTLLEERGARVALLTDPGFEDLIEIARQDRPSLYDSAADRPVPLVLRSDRHSDPENLGEADIVAIVLLGSYADPTAERRLAERVRLPSLLSSDVSPEFREYERLATTVLSAYLTPSVADYLASLDEKLDIPTRLVMTSSGGLIPFDEGGNFAGRLVLSGPAGGVVAAAAVGEHHGFDSVIAFDMGGTSTDVCRISGGVPTIGTGHRVAGRINRVPSVPVQTIGAGGGSIAWVDDGRALRVGPRSAGADPGPASYGRGGRNLTVTDANLLAGNIPSDLQLGGTVSLDFDAASRAAATLAARAGLGFERVVAGTLEVVDARMERALRAVSVEEGADPREAVLVAFGGAGGLHASRLARRLGMAGVLVPPHSGVLSALGLLLATPRSDTVRTVLLAAGDARLAGFSEAVALDARRSFQEMFGQKPTGTTITADVRYPGQAHELAVEVGDWELLARRFHATHSERFGFDRSEVPIEVVNLRAVATGVPPLAWDAVSGHFGTETVAGGDGVWHRPTLPTGFEVEGPAIVVEDNSATLLESGDRMVVLDDGTMRIEW